MAVTRILWYNPGLSRTQKRPSADCKERTDLQDLRMSKGRIYPSEAKTWKDEKNRCPGAPGDRPSLDSPPALLLYSRLRRRHEAPYFCLLPQRPTPDLCRSAGHRRTRATHRTRRSGRLVHLAFPRRCLRILHRRGRRLAGTHRCAHRRTTGHLSGMWRCAQRAWWPRPWVPPP